MKNFKPTLLIIAIAMISAVSHSQNVNVTLTGPATLTACGQNVFTASFTLNTASTLVIHDTIAFGGTAFNTCQSGTGSPVALNLISGAAGSFYHDMANHNWSISLGTGSHTLVYNVFLDCGVVVPDIGNLQNISFIQSWADSAGAFAYTLNGTSQHVVPVAAPFINDITPQQFYGSYLDTTRILFRYRNNGSADAAIQFRFNHSPQGNCTADTMIALEYALGDTTALSFAPLTFDSLQWTSVLLKVDSTLTIRKTIIILGCIGPCNKQTSIMRWKCNYAGAGFCDRCQDLYNSRQHALIQNPADTLGISVNLITPTPFGAQFDTSCMNTRVQWEYHIVNGKRNVPEARILLYHGSPIQYNWGANDLTLIDTNEVLITDYCNGCIASQVSYLHTNALCADSVAVPLGRLELNLRNFMKGDSIIIRYKTYRCCEENDSLLLNKTKWYNRWTLEAKVKDTCGASITATGIKSSNHISGSGDFRQVLEFFPTVSDLTVPPGGAVFGPASPVISVLLKGMIWDATGYQFMGCTSLNTASCTLGGYLRARIHCEKGLVADTPFAHVNITGIVNGMQVIWHPDSVSTTVTPNICEAGDYYFWFNLADTNAVRLLNNGSFNFRLQPCCFSGLPRDAYSIAFHLVALPGMNCDTCALPLSSVGDAIAVHCPGCITPGIIVDNYRMERISLGAKDSNNNRQADIPVSGVDSAYLAVYKPLMRLNNAHHGEHIEDRMLAHFQEGDPTSAGGYSYVQMTDSSVFLHYLMMERGIEIGTDSTQVQLTPYYLKLYIDTPSVNAFCMDCGEYDAAGTGYRTVHAIETSDTSQINGLYVQYNAQRNAFFFTFGAENGQSNLFQNVVFTDTLQPFSGFGERQRYRLKVRYRVCGYFHLPDSMHSDNIEDRLKKAEITNNMFLCGKVHGTDVASQLPLAGDVGGLPSPLIQNFADSTLFRCETFGGRFYFYSDDAINASRFDLINNNRCSKQIVITSIAVTGNNSFSTDTDPYEYRLAAFEPEEFRIHIPPGFSATQAQYATAFFTPGFMAYSNPPRNLFFASSDTLVIAADSLLGRACYQEGAPGTYPDSTLYINEGYTRHYISIPLTASDCDPGAAYHPLHTDVIIRYRNRTLDCANGIAAGCTPVSFDRLMRVTASDTINMQFPNPFLYAQMLPVQADGNAINVCWSFKIADSNQVSSDSVYHVFLIPPAASNLTGWHAVINGTAYPANANGIISLGTFPPYFSVSGSLCAVFLNCNTPAAMSLVYGWNCSGIPLSDTSAVCFSNSTPMSLNNTVAVVTAEPMPVQSTYDLCVPVIIGTKFKSKALGFSYPYLFSTDSLAANAAVSSVYLYNCSSTDSTALAPAGQPLTWSITATALNTIGIADSSLAMGECIGIKVFITPQCGFEGALQVPEMNLSYLKYCGDSAVVTAVFDSASSIIAWSGISNCTDCFSITKLASADTVAAGDTLTYSIILCAANSAPDTVTLHELLPTGFIMTSGNITQQVPLPAQGCDTVLVQGYFTTMGECIDNINTAQLITSQNDTLTADACVTVMFPCWQSGILEIPDNAVSSSYGSMISNDTLMIRGTFYISNDFTLKNCLVYMAGGAKIELLPPPQYGLLTLDSTVIQGCDTMWYGIELLKESILWATHSTLRDAERAVIAGDSSYVFADSCLFADNIIGIYTPSNMYGGLNTIALFIIRNRFGMESASLKIPYDNQQIYGATPYSGIVVYDTPLSLNLYENDNRFFNMNMGVFGFRSLMNIKYCRFDNIQPDTSYGNPFDGSAIVSLGKYSSVPGRLYAGRYQRNDTTMLNCHTGVFTDFSMFDVRDIKMINMHKGVYGTRTHYGLTGYAGNLFIEAAERGIEWFNNAGAADMKAEANIIKVDNDNAVGIELTENSATTSSNYTVTQNNVTVRNGLYGIAGTLVNNAKLHFNHVALKDALSGIIMNSAERCSLNCNTSRSYDAGDTTKTGIEINQSLNTWMSCNTVDSTGWGITFSSACAGTVLRANVFKDHFEGLRLDGSAIIDPQQLKGNRWMGTYASGYGAVNWNSNNQITVSFNEFTVQDSLPGTIYHPYNFVICSGCSWFVPQAGTPDRCTGQYACNASLTTGDPAEELSDVDYRIAEDSLRAAEYEEETKRMAEQYLFDKLTDNDSLRQSEQVFEDFHSSKKTEEPGLINKVNHYIENIFSMDAQVRSMIESNRNYADSLFLVINTNVTNFVSGLISMEQLTAVNGFLIQQINQSLHENDSLLTIQSSQRILWADSIDYFNSQMQSNETVYQNEKAVNEVYRIYLLNSDSVTAAQKQTLTAIAEQCPKAGGQAVYKARSVLKYFNGSMVYNDRATCSQQGYNREAASQKMTKALALIKPNPAKETITLIHLFEVKAGTKFVITDVLNRVLFAADLPEGKQAVEFNVSSLSNGLYFFRIVTNKERLFHGKFVISK